MKNKLKLFILSFFMLFLCSCTTMEYVPKSIIEQQSLLIKCTNNTPMPTNYVLNDKGEKVYQGAEIFKVLKEWEEVYNKCAINNDALVDTILKLDNKRLIENHQK